MRETTDVKTGIQEAPVDQNNREEKERTNTMTKVISIEGMMCNHCRMHVEKALNGIEGLRAVVTLDPPAATVEFTGREPELAELQRVLSEDYKITER